MNEQPSKIPIEFEEDEEISHKEDEKLKYFPKKIGIVFAEKRRLEKILNFDQIACTHLLLQMNSVQKIFEFQVITHEYTDQYFSMPPQDDHNDRFFEWFDTEISKFDNSNYGKSYGIDYWIGITSINLQYNRFVRAQKRENGKSNKVFWIMTTDVWESKHTPPSLFEYIAITVLMCSINFISNDFNGSLYFHKELKTKGCIFDFTVMKEHRRLVVSNPYLCLLCEKRLMDLQRIIMDKYSIEVFLSEQVKRVLSKEWMGGPEQRNSPTYNLKKNYGYDLDRNSGFYKKPLEQFRDSIIENSAEWIIGGIIAAALSLVGAYFTLILGLGN
jgi:hypothetical protein